MGFPAGVGGKELQETQETHRGEFDPLLVKIPGEGNGNPLQYSCLGNSMDGGVWWATVHGVTRVRQNLVTKPPPPTALQEKQPNLTTNTKNEMLRIILTMLESGRCYSKGRNR